MKEDIEIWRPVQGYEGFYEVSSLGRVRSLDRTITAMGKYGQYGERTYKGKILKPYDSEGYWNVDLIVSGKRTRAGIHRLMAKAFIPNPDNLPLVNHINENRKDNRVENLEWVTYRENTVYGTAIERAKLHRPLFWEKPVEQLTMSGEVIARYQSLSAAARAVDGDSTCIQRVCDGRSRHHHGYRWRWAE